MKILDGNGVFGGKERNIFISAEVMPPDASNIARAKRLNPEPVFENWYQETSGNHAEDTETRSRFYYEAWHPKLCDIILNETVSDMHTILKLKKMLNHNGSMSYLVKECSNVPFLLMENVNYQFVMEGLQKNPELRHLLTIKQH